MGACNTLEEKEWNYERKRLCFCQMLLSSLDNKSRPLSILADNVLVTDKNVYSRMCWSTCIDHSAGILFEVKAAAEAKVGLFNSETVDTVSSADCDQQCDFQLSSFKADILLPLLRFRQFSSPVSNYFFFLFVNLDPRSHILPFSHFEAPISHFFPLRAMTWNGRLSTPSRVSAEIPESKIARNYRERGDGEW